MKLKLLPLAALFATALSGPSMAQDTIKLGAVTPNAGPMAALGGDLARSYELAADWINARGGLLGRKVEIIRGDAATPQEGIAAVDFLVGSKKVDIVIGTIATAISNSASETALNHNKLYWETNALARDLTERGLPNFARSGPSSDNFAKIAAEGVTNLVAKSIGKPAKDLKVWVGHEDSSYGTSVAKEVERLLKSEGATVSISAHSARATDLTDTMLRMKAFGPDVWINAGYVADTNLLLKTAQQQGIKPAAVVLIGVGDTVETLNALGKEYMDGIAVVTYPRVEVNPSYSPGAKEFFDDYLKKFGSPPFAPSGISGYAGLRILFDVIKEANSLDTDKILATAKKMDKPVGSYPAGYGVKFDAKMQNTRGLPIMSQWQDGKNVVIYPQQAMVEGTKAVSFARK